MELRGDDEEIGTPSTLCYNPANRESSAKFPNSPLPTAAESRRDQTFAQLHFAHHQNQNPPRLSLHQNLHKNIRDHSNPNPDPIPSITTSPSTITQLIPRSRSVSRTPPTSENNNVPSSTIHYRECLKNHAASSGGHVLDGCGEFMPGGEDGTLEALKCAACECHRNFHRKDTKDERPQPVLPSSVFISGSVTNNGHRSDRTAPPLPHHHQFPAVPISSMMMAFGGSNGAPAESSSEDLNTYHQSNGAREFFSQQQQLSKKRFRTKFTQAQKEKMLEFGEKLGWKIQKQDELEVQHFCSELGVKRQVFKVWMHNNKQAMKKKEM